MKSNNLFRLQILSLVLMGMSCLACIASIACVPSVSPACLPAALMVNIACMITGVTVASRLHHCEQMTARAEQIRKVARTVLSSVGDDGELQKYRRLVNTLPIGILLWSDNGLIDECNASCATKFGYNIDELIGKPVSEVIPQAETKLFAFDEEGADHLPRTMHGRGKQGQPVDFVMSASTYIFRDMSGEEHERGIGILFE